MPDEVVSPVGPFGEAEYGGGWQAPVGPGLLDPSAATSSAFLSATPVHYGTIELQWSFNHEVAERFAVARAAFGPPISRSGGVVVAEGPAEAVSRSTRDGGLRPGGVFYYSLFVLVDDEWLRVAEAGTVAVKDWGYHAELWRSLPDLYKVLDRQRALSVESGQLFRFLKIFAFELDLVRTYAALVPKLRDVEVILPPLLAQYAYDLSVKDAQTLGVTRLRGILRSIMRWRHNKGTWGTLEEIVRTITGNAEATIELSPNLMKSRADTEFFDGTLGWWYSEDHSNAALETVASTVGPGARSGDYYMRLTATAAGTYTIRNNVAAPWQATHGFRVVPGTVYTFSIYARSGGTTRTVSVGLDWFDREGNPVAAAGAVNSSPAVGSGSWQRPTVTQEAPEGAVFAAPTITVASMAAGNTMYFDEAMSSASGAALDYDSPNKVVAKIPPTIENLLPNPSFEVDTTGWSGSLGAISRTTTESVVGSASLELGSAPPGYAAALFSNHLPVDGGVPYVFSGYCKVPGLDEEGSTHFASLEIEWFTSGFSFLGFTNFQSQALGSSWRRLSNKGVAPSNAAIARVWVTHWTPGTESLLVDGLMFHRGIEVLPYFDGSFSSYDYYWRGTAHNSASGYIPRRALYESILGQYLEDFTPPDTIWAISYN
jgi:hypothetical protein